uniref:NADH-plastoquinone oxidoreductase subunit 2 n=1 Tax=Limodorum abortivum TaxID=242627 RepID=A0A411GVC4_9ASPA|nr:NADH-plastoquinone oxidoreductase subunit 2 [Limodorum abortivum]QBB09960.1 NADH-plastoquinone oxidoreductase subunit 2 [Limodorum abortivum]
MIWHYRMKTSFSILREFL